MTKRLSTLFQLYFTMRSCNTNAWSVARLLCVTVLCVWREGGMEEWWGVCGGCVRVEGGGACGGVWWEVWCVCVLRMSG